MKTAAPEPIWLVTPEKVNAVVGRLVEVGRPRKIILFGSYVRGEITPDSDLDVLVVTGDDVEDARQESVRLRSAMRGILMPMDILAVQESVFHRLKDKIGLIYGEALRNGKVVYDAPA